MGLYSGSSNRSRRKAWKRLAAWVRGSCSASGCSVGCVGFSSCGCCVAGFSCEAPSSCCVTFRPSGMTGWVSLLSGIGGGSSDGISSCFSAAIVSLAAPSPNSASWSSIAAGPPLSGSVAFCGGHPASDTSSSVLPSTEASCSSLSSADAVTVVSLSPHRKSRRVRQKVMTRVIMSSLSTGGDSLAGSSSGGSSSCLSTRRSLPVTVSSALSHNTTVFSPSPSAP
mmetsp:Transcript_40387/g.101048  ORF Transcript_40387/g.101048 Transcript_40387/m.101048 type:complete len:225 (-) Transcript_40387:609-1283(-)